MAGGVGSCVPSGQPAAVPAGYHQAAFNASTGQVTAVKPPAVTPPATAGEALLSAIIAPEGSTGPASAPAPATIPGPGQPGQGGILGGTGFTATFPFPSLWPFPDYQSLIQQFQRAVTQGQTQTPTQTQGRTQTQTPTQTQVQVDIPPLFPPPDFPSLAPGPAPATQVPPAELAPLPVTTAAPVTIVPQVPAPPVQTQTAIQAQTPFRVPATAQLGLTPQNPLTLWLVNLIAMPQTQQIIQPAPVQIQPINVTTELPGIGDLVTAVNAGLQSIGSELQAVGQATTETIASAANALIPTTEEVGTAITTELHTLSTTLSDQLPMLAQMVVGAGQYLIAQLPSIQTGLADAIAAGVGTGNALSADAIFPAPPAGALPDLSGLGLPCVPKSVYAILGALGGLGLLTGGLEFAAMGWDLTRVALDAVTAPVRDQLTQSAYQDCPVLPLDPVSLVAAWRRGAATDSQLVNDLEIQGYGPERRTEWLAATRELLSAGEILDSMLRGVQTPDEALRALSARGYSPGDGAQLLRLAQFKPTPQDAISWMLRDLFPADVLYPNLSDGKPNGTYEVVERAANFVEKFGLDLEFPESVTPLFEANGISSENMHRFWQAHWQLPSPEQGADMFRRGLIGEGDFIRLLRAIGYEPYWRSGFKGIIYNPIPRVQLRQIAETAGFTHEELVKRYGVAGYSPQDAEILATYTERYVASHKQGKQASLTAGAATAARTAFVDGLLSEAQLADHLGTLGYDQAAIDQYVASSSWERTNKVMAELRGAVRTAYTSGRWSAQQARGALAAANFPGETIDRLLPAWSIERDIREASPVETKHRELTLSEITTGLKDNVITSAQAGEALAVLGYDAAERDIIIAEAEYALARITQNTIIAGIEGEFKAGAITAAAASARLDSAAVVPARRDALLGAWEGQLAAHTPSVSYATILDWAKAGVITESELAQRLARSRYSQADIGHTIAYLKAEGYKLT